LAHEQIEVLDCKRDKRERRCSRNSTRGDAPVAVTGADHLRNVRTGRRFDYVAEVADLQALASEQRLQQLLSTGTLWSGNEPRVLCARVRQGRKLQRISSRNDYPLLTPSKRDQHGIIKLCLPGHGFDVCIPLGIVEIMEMDCCSDDLSRQKAPIPRLASFRENGETRTTFRQRPLQEGVMATADNGGRFGGNDTVGSRHTRKQPTIQIRAGEKPFAGNLRAGDLALRNQLVKFALLDAQIVSRLRGRQQLEACKFLHIIAQFLPFDFFEDNTPNGTRSTRNGGNVERVGTLGLLLSADPKLIAIVQLSLAITLSATLFAALLGMPLGAFAALVRFPGREVLIVVLNAFMGLPPVVVGLAVFLLLSRSGPLGELGLLFTPTAMVIVQTLLITPIVAALARQVIEDLWAEYRDEFSAMQVGPLARVAALLWDARYSLVTIVLAGFGRAAAEVGAVIIVGGNIDGFTRVMTTTIALETSKGNLALAVGLGIILIGLVMAVNALAWGVRRWSEKYTA
jgi:tungstate transport system permease protein